MKCVIIAGRSFRPIIQSTLKHDVELMRHVQAAGLDPLVPEPGETADMLARRVLRNAVSSGRVFPILAGLLVPDEMKDLDWTPESAKETAEFFESLTDEPDKETVKGQVAALLANFLLFGIASLRNSRSCSETARTEGPGAAAMTSVSGTR